jgi:hypothetical protein
MFADDIERPFDSIESAVEYMNDLATTILEVAADLALFKLKMLGCHVYKSRRMLICVSCGGSF